MCLDAFPLSITPRNISSQAGSGLAHCFDACTFTLHRKALLALGLGLVWSASLPASAFDIPRCASDQSSPRCTIDQLVDWILALQKEIELLKEGNTGNPPIKTPGAQNPDTTELIVDTNLLEYGIWNRPGAGSSRDLKADILSLNPEVNPDLLTRDFNFSNFRQGIEVTYHNDNGFIGIYQHGNTTGKINADVTLKVRIPSYYGDPYLSDDVIIGSSRPIVIEGQNLGTLEFGWFDNVNNNGQFRGQESFGAFSNHSRSSVAYTGAFSTEDTDAGNPRMVAGEVIVYYGTYSNSAANSLVGVFAAGAED